jgi:hypothetical protein
VQPLKNFMEHESSIPCSQEPSTGPYPGPYQSSKFLHIDNPSSCAITEAVSLWLSAAAARVRARFRQVGFVVDKVASGRFSPSTSVSPAKTVHSTNFSIIRQSSGAVSRDLTTS